MPRDLLDEALRLALEREVGRERACLAARGRDLANDRLGAVAAAAVVHGHARPGLGETPGDDPAEAAAGARDERHPALQVEKLAHCRHGRARIRHGAHRAGSRAAICARYSRARAAMAAVSSVSIRPSSISTRPLTMVVTTSEPLSA